MSAFDPEFRGMATVTLHKESSARAKGSDLISQGAGMNLAPFRRPLSLRFVLCGLLRRLLFHIALAIGVVRRFFAGEDPLPLQGTQVVLRFIPVCRAGYL